MQLTHDEQAMLDGKEGPARQKAMDLLIRYGEALGAERLVDTRNVCGTVGASTPFDRTIDPAGISLAESASMETGVRGPAALRILQRVLSLAAAAR